MFAGDWASPVVALLGLAIGALISIKLYWKPAEKDGAEIWRPETQPNDTDSDPG